MSLVGPRQSHLSGSNITHVAASTVERHAGLTDSHRLTAARSHSSEEKVQFDLQYIFHCLYFSIFPYCYRRYLRSSRE